MRKQMEKLRRRRTPHGPCLEGELPSPASRIRPNTPPLSIPNRPAAWSFSVVSYHKSVIRMRLPPTDHRPPTTDPFPPQSKKNLNGLANNSAAHLALAMF